jgi:hypothetical protein
LVAAAATYAISHAEPVMAEAALDLARRVAELASGLGIETALIGAVALAAHNFVLGSQDVDLASHVDPRVALRELARVIEAQGLRTQLNSPDHEDVLGGVLRIWKEADAEGEPIEPVDVVNFYNPLAPRPNPAADAVRSATSLDGTALRYVRLSDLVALKLYAGSRRDEADVVELLARNPEADLAEVRAVCNRYGFADLLDELVAESRGSR